MGFPANYLDDLGHSSGHLNFVLFIIVMTYLINLGTNIGKSIYLFIFYLLSKYYWVSIYAVARRERRAVFLLP